MATSDPPSGPARAGHAERRARVERSTRETEITVEIDLDGSGSGEIDTGVPFFDHLLTALSRHGLIDLRVKARGDVHVDAHHTVEDVGLVLGQALRRAVGDGAGLARFGSARVPMADALVQVDLDLSNRPYFVYRVELPRQWVAQFDAALVEDFLYALCIQGGVDLHVELCYGHNVHHSVEAIFKALGRALRAATTLDPRIEGPLSTKGSL
jgi:imidazoleglycerol-phosphate dehydratase